MKQTRLWVLLALVLGVSSAEAQQTIYWKKDHIYNGPGGKEIATVTPAPSDQTAPAAPTGLSSSSVTATSVQLSWSASTDAGGSGLAGYKIYRQLAPNAALPVGTVAPGVLSFTDQPLKPSQGYTFTIVAFDNAQNHSAASNAITTTTSSAAGDITAPSMPQFLTGRPLSINQNRLDWFASTDTGGAGLAGYQVYRGGVLVSGASPITTVFFEDSSLSPGTTYSYTVKAVDNNGNASSLTSAVSITTLREVIFQDNFDRANAGTLGSPWQTTFGTFQIFQTTAYAPVPASSYFVQYHDAIQSTQTNFKATVTFNQMGLNAGGGAGIFFYRRWHTYRYVGYRALVTQGTVALYYIDDLNTYPYGEVSLGSATAGCGSYPCSVGVETDPSTGNVKVFVNGVVKINTTIPIANMTGGVGIHARSWRTDSVNEPAVLDNFILER